MAKAAVKKKPVKKAPNKAKPYSLGITITKARKDRLVQKVVEAFAEGAADYKAKRNNRDGYNDWCARSSFAKRIITKSLGLDKIFELEYKPKMSKADYAINVIRGRLSDNFSEWFILFFHPKKECKPAMMKMLKGLDGSYDELAARMLINLTLRVVNGESLSGEEETFERQLATE